MDNAAIMDAIGESLGDELSGATGKIPIVTVTIEDILTEQDIAEYVETVGELETTQKSNEKDVNSLRARHHGVARLLAIGLPEGVVAQMTGYQVGYINTLKQTPSMCELISHYRAPGNQAVADMTEKLRLLSDMSLNQLISKVETNELSIQELLQAVKLGADRSGAGPMQKFEHSHEHRLNDETVAKLAASAREANRGRVIDINSVRKALPAPTRGEDEPPDSAA